MAIYSAQDQPNLTVLPVAYRYLGQPTDLLDPNKLRGSHQGIATVTSLRTDVLHRGKCVVRRQV